MRKVISHDTSRLSLRRVAAIFDQSFYRSHRALIVIAEATIGGKLVYEHAFGFQNREDKVPMKTSLVFRIASMSKPINTVSVMMLVEEATSIHYRHEIPYPVYQAIADAAPWAAI